MIVLKLLAFVTFMKLCSVNYSHPVVTKKSENSNDYSEKRASNWLEFLAQRKAEEERLAAQRKAQEEAAKEKSNINSDATSDDIDKCENEFFNPYNVNSDDECWSKRTTSEILKKEFFDEFIRKYGRPPTLNERVKFENEYGRYKERKETKVIDIINAINQAEDAGIGDEVPLDARKVEKYEKSHSRKRDAKRDRIYLWIDRTVPYAIDPSLNNNPLIHEAMQEIQKVSCIKFVPRTTQNNWIKFVRKNGCWSIVGREFYIDGYQEISLGTNCLYKGIIMHEILHALGFYHEQARPDRDNYIEIFWDNIPKEMQGNFQKVSDERIDLMDEEYDYNSIMHYGKFSFAKNTSQPTILSIHNSNQNLGQRQGLSPIDIAQLNKLYDCPNKGNAWSSWSSYGPCDNSCKKERTRFCMDPNPNRALCKNSIDKSLFKWGVDAEEGECTPAECYKPVNGGWNKWGEWSECSATCGKGKHTRQRTCDDPAPKHGGKSCIGNNVHVGVCQKRGCDEGPLDCNFDLNGEPMCNWNLDTNRGSTHREIAWLRRNKPTPSSGTGPRKDHTSGSGYFLFIEASSPAGPGHKARLSSPVIDSPGDKCFQFAYSMYGRSTGTLNVILKNEVSGTEKIVFTKTGDQLDKWHEHEIDFSIQSGGSKFKIIVEAVRGSSFQGDIAIDDFKVKNSRCNVKPGPDNSKPYSSVGCYHDYGFINSRRPFSEVRDYRSHINWSTWGSIQQTLTEIKEKCAKFAKASNYEYFAVEFYGECWTGRSSDVDYSRDGESTDCFTGTSDGKGPFVVGRDYSLMVYRHQPQ